MCVVNTTTWPLNSRVSSSTPCIVASVGRRPCLEVRENSPLAGLDPRNFQPLQIRYTDWVIDSN